MQTGKAAGMKTVGVTWGFRTDVYKRQEGTHLKREGKEKRAGKEKTGNRM